LGVSELYATKSVKHNFTGNELTSCMMVRSTSLHFRKLFGTIENTSSRPAVFRHKLLDSFSGVLKALAIIDGCIKFSINPTEQHDLLLAMFTWLVFEF
jgi:hypothetical protein